MDVNNRVQIALSRLPDDVRRQGVTIRERSPDILQVIAFTSRVMFMMVYGLTIMYQGKYLTK